MAVDDDDVPEVEAFDRPDLALSPEMHRVQAEIPAERGGGYDPYEFERASRERVANAPDPIDDAEPVE